MDPNSNEKKLCLKTLEEHTGRVFRLQFDQFQIVSSSHDDTILIWDFLGNENHFPLPFASSKRNGHSNGNSSNGNLSSSSNGSGAKSRHNSLSNGSSNNLSDSSSTRTLGHNSDNRVQNRNNNINFNNDEKMDSSSTAATTTTTTNNYDQIFNQQIYFDPSNQMDNQLDEEMTNSNEYQNLPSQSTPVEESPFSIRNENEELTETNGRKLSSSNLINNPFNSYLISNQGSKKLNNITNLNNLTNNILNSTNDQLNNNSPINTPIILSASEHQLSNSNNTANLNGLNNFSKGIPLF